MSRKKAVFQYQYEPEDYVDYTEPGVEKGAHIDPEKADKKIDNPDVVRFFEMTHYMNDDGLFQWLTDHASSFDSSTIVVDTDDGNSLQQYRDRHPKVFISRRRLNRIRHLNTFLNRANEELPQGGYLWCNARTAVLKKQLILKTYPPVINYIAYAIYYLWHRVFPKLKFTKWLYFAITKGQNRTYNRVEVLGRMYRAGFEVIDEGFHYGSFYVLARKVKAPIWDDEPTCSPIIKLRRVGEGGHIIGVYKFRTMYSYSEYLQPYIYEHNNLQEGGKIADDYRVNGWGRLFRSHWLDELPMIVNVLKGQMKLFGVRPLSRHYFSLYTPEMQQLRIKVKPGLIPPFYYEAETPKTIEDVQASERRYIEAYLANPRTTDWKYFWGTVRNILFRHKRSK